MQNSISVTIIIFLIEGVHIYLLAKKKLIKEIIVSVALIAIVLFYSYNEIFEWKLPGPTEFIKIATNPIAKLVFGQDIG